jgi:DnaJ homolog subfamily C member 16
LCRSIKGRERQFYQQLLQDENAEAKFVEINRAYELLSDPERRKEYDNYGITEDTPNFRKRHDYAQYGRFDHPFDAFHEFFGAGDGGFRFKFQNGNGDGGQRIYHKQSITSKAYWNNILPNRFQYFNSVSLLRHKEMIYDTILG